MSSIRDQIEAQRFIKNLTGTSKFIISKNSREIGVSRQTYQNKLKGLKDRKIITNYTININPNIRPNNLKFIMLEIKTNPKEPNLAHELLNIPQLRMLDGIFGEYSLFALCIFKSPNEYYQTLNAIDNIMAKSYFKKYKIVETIKVFKTNGISLSNLGVTFKEHAVLVELVIANKINLNQIASNYADVEYDPEKFPGLVMRFDEPRATILIFSTGKMIVTDLKDQSEVEKVVDKVIQKISSIGVNVNKKYIDQHHEIDNIDYEILNILRDGQGHKPISTYEIKNIFKEQHQTEISQSTIHNRIKKLERIGVILNYTVNFHPKKIGYKGKYILRIKPKDPSKYDELALKLERNQYITDLFRIGEQYGLFAIVRVKKVEDYGKFIRDLYETEDIEDTFTNFVLDELIPYTNFVIP